MKKRVREKEIWVEYTCIGCTINNRKSMMKTECVLDRHVVFGFDCW